MQNKSKKVVLATGIFYPDVGGPAIHVRKIAEALHVAGYKPVVIAYGGYDGPQEFPFKVVRISNKLTPFLRRLRYAMTVLKESLGAQMLYAFNLGTAGLPVFVAGKLLRKKILIRVPGDPIWERKVERGGRFVSFVNYYEQGLHKIDRPKFFSAIRYILPKFDEIVFYSPFLSEAYQRHYGVPSKKITVVLNPVSRRELLPVTMSVEPTLLFAGRFVAYKNLELLIRTFDKVCQKIGKGRLIMIGEGPDKEKLEKIIRGLPSVAYVQLISKVNQEKLFEHICSSWIGIGPALTEFNPNFILECLSFGKPVLLSRENGLSVKLPEEFLFDSGNENELAEKMTRLFEPAEYKRALETVAQLELSQSWEKVIEAHMKLINK